MNRVLSGFELDRGAGHAWAGCAPGRAHKVGSVSLFNLKRAVNKDFLANELEVAVACCHLSTSVEAAARAHASIGEGTTRRRRQQTHHANIDERRLLDICFPGQLSFPVGTGEEQ